MKVDLDFTNLYICILALYYKNTLYNKLNYAIMYNTSNKFVIRSMIILVILYN